MPFHFITSGESHGPVLTAVVSGLPAGLAIDAGLVNEELARRQQGYGRGARMKIEKDEAQILSGLRFGKTLGSPITLQIKNRDWEHWQTAMNASTEPVDVASRKSVARPRPGHADLAGALKYNTKDARDILERASARETAARVAAGALAKQFLKEFGIEIVSHTVAVGGVVLPEAREVTFEEAQTLRSKPDSRLRCVDEATEARMVETVHKAATEGNTVGGCFEIIAHGVVAGLGSHTSWDARLDGLLARALASIQAVKAVEIGTGMQNAMRWGSEVHDEIAYSRTDRAFIHDSNRAGGIEGGISNGEEIRLRGYLKPISTLKKPLRSVNMETKEVSEAAFERSDVCVVPAAGVIGEAMVALVLAQCFLEKFGGDSMVETGRNYRGYCEQLKNF
ncbi:MAG: chorismate synthase [Acidobacteriia bacterium]|nr:chorismate synthase [Terriglobia bacterium]